MLGRIEEDLMQVVHGDVVGLWGQNNMMGFAQKDWKPFDMDDGTPTWIGGGFECDVDAEGNRWVYACGDRSAKYAQCMPAGGSFFDNVDHSAEEFDFDLDPDEWTPREDYREDFQIATDEDARYWEEQAKKLFEETNYAIVGLAGGGGFGDAGVLPGPALKNPKGIRKLEDWIMAHAICPEYIEEVFAFQTEVALKNLQMYKEAVGERIQVLWLSATDFGTQTGLFMRPDQFRELYKPYYRKLNDWIHENTGWKIFYHTCGCIVDILDDLCEIGVDIINPVQFSAMEHRGMTPQKIKELYGDKMTFWGGGVDTQQVLPFGTPEEVRRQVKERVDILNQGGGYVFSSIHNVVSGVPAENLIAMYETVLGEKLR